MAISNNRFRKPMQDLLCLIYCDPIETLLLKDPLTIAGASLIISSWSLINEKIARFCFDSLLDPHQNSRPNNIYNSVLASHALILSGIAGDNIGAINESVIRIIKDLDNEGLIELSECLPAQVWINLLGLLNLREKTR